MRIADELIVPIAVGVFACNVACAVWLIVFHRPGRKAVRPTKRPLFDNALRGCVAEAIGTFAIVFLGTLAAWGGPVGATGVPSLVAVALAVGLTVAVMMTTFGNASGGHFNPAVTLGLVAAGRLHPLVGVFYWLAQMLAAVMASVLLFGMFGPASLKSALPAPAEQVTLYAALAVEAISTFFVVLVFFGTSDFRGPKYIAPLAVGSMVAACILAIGPLTGAALNPARYLGPALLLGEAETWVVYLAGPCLGGCTAAVLMQFFFRPEESALEGFEATDSPTQRIRRAA
jgi:MIP family channel proteins